MTAEGLWKTIGSQKFDGKKIWDKAVAIRREITTKIIPAWNRQLNGDGTLPSGINSVDVEAENSLLKTLQGWTYIAICVVVEDALILALLIACTVSFGIVSVTLVVGYFYECFFDGIENFVFQFFRWFDFVRDRWYQTCSSPSRTVAIILRFVLHQFVWE